MLQAYVDLVKAWGWKSFTIIYDSNDGLVRLQELLKAHGPSEFPITVRQLGEGSEYRWVASVCSLFFRAELLQLAVSSPRYAIAALLICYTTTLE